MVQIGYAFVRFAGIFARDVWYAGDQSESSKPIFCHPVILTFVHLQDEFVKMYPSSVEAIIAPGPPLFIPSTAMTSVVQERLTKSNILSIHWFQEALFVRFRIWLPSKYKRYSSSASIFSVRLIDGITTTKWLSKSIKWITIRWNYTCNFYLHTRPIYTRVYYYFIILCCSLIDHSNSN